MNVPDLDYHDDHIISIAYLNIGHVQNVFSFFQSLYLSFTWIYTEYKNIK